jgi:hypothetical protein
MSEIVPSGDNWKRQSYIFGLSLGTLVGLLAAYLYNRAIEEDLTRKGAKPDGVSTGQMISLSLATLGIIRQITELGKSPKK